MLTHNVVPFAPTPRPREGYHANRLLTVRNENLNVLRRAFAAYLSFFPAERQERALLYAVDIIVAELVGTTTPAAEHSTLDPAS